MEDKLVKESIVKIKDYAEKWINMVNAIGNQCAITDRMAEAILEEAEKLKGSYNNLFEKKTYYIAFEQQGYEELIVRTEATCEDEAYNIAQDAFIGDKVDRYIVEPKNLGRYDCPIIDASGEELTYGECMLDEEGMDEEE